MATYLKRSSKLFERLAAVNNSARSTNSGSGATSSQETTEPTLRELICPVCRSLLREPVTLPCAHNLCLRCLRGTVEHNSLSCPLCRQRVGSWLRAATKADTLVNAELWQLIRRRFPEELELAAGEGVGSADAADLHLDPEFAAKKILSAAGEIRREYEVQLQIAEEEMRREREKERLASEALIRKIQEEEEQEKLVQLAQDQLLAKTLAKQDVIEKTNYRNERSTKSTGVAHSDKSKPDASQSKSTANQKMSVKTKDVTDVRKQNVALISKIRSERYASSTKSSLTNIQKESSETFSSQKPVPIHNAVTRVVTHQNRLSQPNNSTYPAALGELTGSTSKIYGLQSKEELHVPSDVLSSKKKKLGVEVCVTTVEGEERIGSAESAGSHDSINQEIHHFKPIKALPRTPLRIALDGRQVDPKLIRVLPILKRVSNAMPKPPTPTHLKKMFGCSWSAFKRISKQQVLLKDSPSGGQHQQETKKTDKKMEQSRSISKSTKPLQDYDERNAEVAFDSNKNYTKNINKIMNGTKVSKKLNLDDQTNSGNSAKQSKRAGKLKNGLLLGNHKKEPSNVKPIEIVDLDDDDRDLPNPTPDPLAFTPKNDTRPPSPTLELAMENIAERIKRRKTKRTASNTENVQSAINSVVPIDRSTKVKSKKTSATTSRKQKTKKAVTATKPKTKTKTATTTTITSQIKRLAARSTKRPRYTEDSEEEDEDQIVEQRQAEANEEQKRLEANEVAELDRSAIQASPTPPPVKKPRKNAKTKKQSNKKPTATVTSTSVEVSNVSLGEASEEEAAIKEQERLEKLAAQERKDRELALQLQARFNAMERIAGRTRRGAARLPSPVVDQPVPKVVEKRPQKRAAMK